MASIKPHLENLKRVLFEDQKKPMMYSIGQLYYIVVKLDERLKKLENKNWQKLFYMLYLSRDDSSHIFFPNSIKRRSYQTTSSFFVDTNLTLC